MKEAITDSPFYPVTCCPACHLPQCEHAHCINRQCSHYRQCQCETFYQPDEAPVKRGHVTVEPRVTAFMLRYENREQFPQKTTSPKKRGRPRGITKEHLNLTLDKSVVEFLNSLSNKSQAANDILLQSEEYQYWRDTHLDEEISS